MVLTIHSQSIMAGQNFYLVLNQNYAAKGPECLTYMISQPNLDLPVKNVSW